MVQFLLKPTVSADNFPIETNTAAIMNTQPSKKVHCVAIDPDPIRGGVGGVEWRASLDNIERLYQQLSVSPAHDGDTLIRFDLMVPANAAPEQITNLADAAAWEHSYHEIHRMVVAVEH